MQDPTELYQFEAGTDPRDIPAPVLFVALDGFVDAGGTQRLLTRHLLDTHDNGVVASFDVDQLHDYRGRRPAMTFDRDRWTAYTQPSLRLHRVLDKSGHPFLVLAGDEPDYQWERVTASVIGLVRTLGVGLTVTVHGIPMAIPHTRPLGMTPHATDSHLIEPNEPMFGAMQVPGSLTGLLEYRLGEAGLDAIGYAVHVPHYLAQAEYVDAAVAGLDALARATGLDLDRSELLEKADANRAQIAEELAQSEEVQAVVSALEQQYDRYVEGRGRPGLLPADGAMPTADELGAEFEAFLKDVSEEGGSPGAGDR